MSTPCQLIETKYRRDTKSQVYTSVLPADRSNYLLKQERGHKVDGKFVAGPAPNVQRENTFNLGQPVTQETGFLDYVNRFGFQCINKITGHVHDTDENGMVKTPNGVNAPVKEDCVLSCYQVRGNSKECFNCIAASQYISRCPFQTNDTDEIAQTLKEAVQCTSVISETDLSEDQVFKAIDRPYVEENVDNTIYYVLASIGGLLLCIFLILMYYYKWKNSPVQQRPM